MARRAHDALPLVLNRYADDTVSLRVCAGARCARGATNQDARDASEGLMKRRLTPMVSEAMLEGGEARAECFSWMVTRSAWRPYRSCYLIRETPLALRAQRLLHMLSSNRRLRPGGAMSDMYSRRHHTNSDRPTQSQQRRSIPPASRQTAAQPLHRPFHPPHRPTRADGCRTGSRFPGESTGRAATHSRVRKTGGVGTSASGLQWVTLS